MGGAGNKERNHVMTKKYYATTCRNGTEDEIIIHAPDGREMLCVGFWDAEWDDDPMKHNADQLKADALLIVNALNAYAKKPPRSEAKASAAKQEHKK
jgi:hypothetical protein